jgi:5-formyltetrahydrofolate cyclo-ligase
VWERAATVKANPDSPQWPVRQRALEDGKVVYMAVPRLARADPFFLLDPDHLADTPRRASSIKGATASARTVALEAIEPVDLVVTGCVAVGRMAPGWAREAGSATWSSRSPRKPA